MTKRFLTLAFLIGVLISCKKDEAASCVTCSAELTTPFELCRENNGNAYVNGENTEVPYSDYLEDLEDEGVDCF